MFRCKECGTEYEIRPDYCDCGNDTFDEIKPQIKNKIPSIPKTEPQKTVIKETVNHEYQKINRNFDYLSVGIFTVCIIFSILIIFFVWNPKEQSKIDTKQKVSTEIKNIPDIDSFWDNTVKKSAQPKIEIKNNQQTKSEPVNIIKNITKPAASPKITVTVKQPQKTVVKQQSVNKQPQTKVTVKQTQKTQTPKQVQTKTQAQAQTQVSKQTQTKPQTSTTQIAPDLTKRVQQNAQNSVKTSTQTAQNVQTQQQKTQNTLNQTQQTQTVQQVQEPPKPKTATKQEFNDYKIALRNTIGRKIDFTKVVGDGSCSLTFKVNSDGKLTNRAFAQQSTNLTLNDAVYSAMLSTPSFKTPPVGYENKTYNLTIKFYNGNFDISLN